jgi:flavorubredoxin
MRRRYETGVTRAPLAPLLVMTVVDSHSGTSITEIADGVHRISTPLPPSVVPGGFSFNQYLLVDDEPLLFHTGMKSIFPLVRAAIEHVIPIERLRWIACSHNEADECGALVEMLSAAPEAQLLCGRVAAMIAFNDASPRPPHVLADGESIALGRKRFTWFDAAHVPHNWESGFAFESTTRTLLCGDLFTQGGADLPAVTESEIVGPSHAFRGVMDYYSLHPDTAKQIERLAATEPAVLACMHGSAFRGDGAAQLRELARTLQR